MDPLGKKGEAAIERTERLEDRIAKTESHLEALDSALQDFTDNYQSLFHEELIYHNEEISKIKELSQKNNTEALERRLDKLESRVERQRQDLEALRESDLKDTISELTKEFKKTRRMLNGFTKRLSKVEKQVDSIESEVVVEMNNRDFDFEKKLDRRVYEKNEERLETDIRKLKTAVNALADQVDGEDNIEVE